MAINYCIEYHLSLRITRAKEHRKYQQWFYVSLSFSFDQGCKSLKSYSENSQGHKDGSLYITLTTS